MNKIDSFQAKSVMSFENKLLTYFSLQKLGQKLNVDLNRLPFSIKILLENLLRNQDNKVVKSEDIEALARWNVNNSTRREIPFFPARVLMQDFTGVPAIADLAAMRNAIQQLTGNTEKVNPIIPVELVIDHSVQVDSYGSESSLQENIEKEYKRNSERYSFLRWAQTSFKNFKVVPPATGICHQINLEYLARIVFQKEISGDSYIYPDTLVGMDSHTTMINSVGVMGWGVGGIEAEAVMLGQPYYLLTPDVVGFELKGELAENLTATDLVLCITEILRKQGVVGKFVEFFGEGLNSLSLADRATISNMAPEYGATMGFFPVDDETLKYMELTGRSKENIQIVEKYCKEQGLFRTKDMLIPEYSDILSFDISTVTHSLAGPKRPQDRIELSNMKEKFYSDFKSKINDTDSQFKHKAKDKLDIDHGAVVIAAIASCTNTSNPSVLLGAGIMARNAVKNGLTVPPWVKTSLAPGSKVVTDYLKKAGLLEYLEKLRFHVVAYGCATCIGNSGPLDEQLEKIIKEKNLVTASVSSGNRNFEGRINPLTRANYLASPILVIAYAIAGTVDIDFEKQALGYNSESRPVFLKDIWPKKEEIDNAISFVKPEMYIKQYSNVYEGDDNWKAIETKESELYNWYENSTYIKKPPFFKDVTINLKKLENIKNARAVVMLGHTVTTDHISPAGAIPQDSPSADYLKNNSVEVADFNSFGSRRGNHEVMMRGTFSNVRLQNMLVAGVEGGYTRNFPSCEKMSIFDSSMLSQENNVPLIVLAGKEYGTGSSRDWAAKGTLLIGIRAVIAESFERIHRSNLIGMGVLPLQFKEGESIHTLGIEGNELFDISGISVDFEPEKELSVVVTKKDDTKIVFNVIARIDSQIEATYYKHGGILLYVLRKMAKK